MVLGDARRRPVLLALGAPHDAVHRRQVRLRSRAPADRLALGLVRRLDGARSPRSSAGATSRRCAARAWPPPSWRRSPRSPSRSSSRSPRAAASSRCVTRGTGRSTPMLAVSLIGDRLRGAARRARRRHQGRRAAPRKGNTCTDANSGWRLCGADALMEACSTGMAPLRRRESKGALPLLTGGARANDNDQESASRIHSRSVSIARPRRPSSSTCRPPSSVSCAARSTARAARIAISRAPASSPSSRGRRPGIPALTRLWSTARSTTRDAEAFFELLPDGPVMPALRFAAICELLAASSMLLLRPARRRARRARLAAGTSRSIRTRAASRLRVVFLGVPAFAALLVFAHAVHALSIDVGAAQERSAARAIARAPLRSLRVRLGPRHGSARRARRRVQGGPRCGVSASLDLVSVPGARHARVPARLLSPRGRAREEGARDGDHRRRSSRRSSASP